MEHFDVLSYPKLFHNLKAAVKEVCTGDKNQHIYYEDVRIPGEEMRKIVEDRDFGKLPDSMRIAGEEAYETLLHTGDGQLCDVIIDRAALDAIYQAGKESPDKIIQDYAESTVAVADIKIAVRSQKTAKSTDFMKRAMAECDSLSVSQLSKAALSGMDAICEYLRGTAYAEGADALAESPSAFERWCDNWIIQTISPEKYHAFTIGPVIAYVIARQNEIKTVRIILSGKQKELPMMERREGKDWIGLRITYKGKVTDLYINQLADGRLMHSNSWIEADGWFTDAYMFAVTYEEDADPADSKDLFVCYGSALRRGTTSYFASLSKLFIIQKEENRKLKLWIEGQPKVHATFGNMKRPSALEVNEKAMPVIYERAVVKVKY